MTKWILWLALVWGILATLLGVIVLGTGADIDMLAAARDIRELVAANGANADQLAYLDSRPVMVRHTAVALALTGLVLLVASIAGLKRKPAAA